MPPIRKLLNRLMLIPTLWVLRYWQRRMKSYPVILVLRQGGSWEIRQR